jgi:hypothetical protein
MKSGKIFSWLFIAVIAVGAWWILTKLAPGSTPFSSQRGLQGTDQFGNPISPGSSGTLSS